MEDIHAGLCAARLLISPLARLGKVKVGAVGLPGRGDGAVSPSVSGPRPLQGPPSPAPRESSVQVPGSLGSPSLCLLPSCARLSRAGVTLCPQEKAQGSSSPACPPARPAPRPGPRRLRGNTHRELQRFSNVAPSSVAVDWDIFPTPGLERGWLWEEKEGQ